MNHKPKHVDTCTCTRAHIADAATRCYQDTACFSTAHELWCAKQRSKSKPTASVYLKPQLFCWCAWLQLEGDVAGVPLQVNHHQSGKCICMHVTTRQQCRHVQYRQPQDGASHSASTAKAQAGAIGSYQKGVRTACTQYSFLVS